MIIAICFLTCLLPISYLLGRKSYKNYITNFFKTGKGKFGIIVYTAYSSIDHVIEVEEIEKAGDLTKVRVVRVCSCAGSKDLVIKYSQGKVLTSGLKPKRLLGMTITLRE